MRHDFDWHRANRMFDASGEPLRTAAPRRRFLRVVLAVLLAAVTGLTIGQAVASRDHHDLTRLMERAAQEQE